MEIAYENNWSESIMNTAKEYSAPREETSVQFFADVELGVFSKNCINYGICRINPLIDTLAPKKKTSCASLTASIFYFNPHKVEIVFPKGGLGKKCENKFFSGNYFKVEEDFTTSFASIYGLEHITINIRKGRYLISKTSKDYHVVFS